MFRATTVAATLIASAAVIASGCQIEPGDSSRGLLIPRSPGPVKLGEVCILGITFCLWDIDGDGVPDQILDPTASQLFRIQVPPGGVPGEGADEVKQWIPGPLQPAAPGILGDDRFDWVEPYIDWDAGWDPPQPFDFGELTAEQWLESVGLDVEPGEPVTTSSLVLEAVDLRSWHTEAWISWSSAFAFPALGDFDLQFETWALPSVVADAPKFLAIHVAGDARDVIRLAVSMGFREHTFENDGSQWMVRVVDGGRAASLYRDGIWLTTVPLE